MALAEIVTHWPGMGFLPAASTCPGVGLTASRRSTGPHSLWSLRDILCLPVSAWPTDIATIRSQARAPLLLLRIVQHRISRTDLQVKQTSTTYVQHLFKLLYSLLEPPARCGCRTATDRGKTRRTCKSDITVCELELAFLAPACSARIRVHNAHGAIAIDNV